MRKSHILFERIKKIKKGGRKGRMLKRIFGFFARIAKTTGNIFKSILGMVVYIAMIPVILQLLNSLTGTVTGTAGVLVSAILAIVPLLLIVKVLDYLEF